MQRNLRVLILEDRPADAELMAAELRRRAFTVDWRRVDTEEAFLAALADPLDLILSDHNLPSYDGLRALQALDERGLDIPFILVTGAVGEEVAAACMRAGASDYLLKDRLGRLGVAVEQALERHSLREQRRTAVARIRFLNRLLDTIREVNRLIVRERDRVRLQQSTCRVIVEHGRFQMAWIGDVDQASGRMVPVAAAGATEYLERVVIRHDVGPEAAGPSGRSVREGRTYVVDDIATDTAFAPWRQAALEHGLRSSISLPLTVGGQVIAALAVYSSEPRTFEGEIVGLLEELAGDLSYALQAIVTHDEHERAVAALARSEERFRILFESAPYAYYLSDLNGVFVDGNRAAEEITGFERKELIGKSFFELDLLPPAMFDRAAVLLAANQRREPTSPEEFTLVRKDDTEVAVEISTHPVDIQGQTVVLGIARDVSERKRAQEALRESERRLATVMGNLPGMAYRCRNEARWTVLFASQGALPLTGYAPEELLENGRVAFGDLIHPDDRDRVVREVEAATQKGRPFVVEYRIEDAAGSEKWVWEQGIEVEPGILEGLIVDVTDRKRAEMALAESERFARSTIDALSKHIAVLDENGTIIAVNRAWREFADANQPVTANVNEGADYLDVCDQATGEDAETAARVAAGIRAVMAGELEDFTGEYPCHSPAEQRWFMCRVTPFPPGGPLRVVVSHENISKRKLAERALRTSEERYRDVVELIGEGIAVTDNDQRFTFTNPAACEIFGVPHDELTGRLVTDFLDGEGRDLVARQTRHRLQGERSQYDVTITRPDGERRQILITATPQWDTEHNVIGTFGIFRDITENRELEAQLRQAQKMEAVGRLAGGVAHDFNNLLQAFSGLTRGLRLHAGDPAGFDDRIEELGNMIRRGSQLTRQLLIFSRRETFRPETLDLGDVVQGTQKLFRHLLRENIRLETRLARGPLPIEADRGQLEQVLVNLAVNAQDAMPGGGRLLLGTSREEGGWAVLTVLDSGCGIAEEIRDKIFEPFFTTKEAGHGTGLGLAVVHGIVSRAGGTITLESQPGEGSAFFVRLPLAAAGARPQPESSTAERRPEGGGQTVLVVEDEEPVRRSICEMLEMIGYQAIAAPSAGAVAAVVADRTPDLVISDVVLADGSGVEVIARLRERQPGLPAIAMSGYSTEIGLLQELGARAITFLQKPFDFDVLADEVRSLLEPSGTQDPQ